MYQAVDLDGLKLERNSRGYLWARVGRRGRVLLHRLVMENAIGRRLLPTEVVHHRDGNPLHNELDNLELLTGGSREHGERHRSPPKGRRCPVCGRPFVPTRWLSTASRYSRQRYCSPACRRLGKRSTEQKHQAPHRPPPHPGALQKLVWALPSETVGRWLGMSGRNVGKWCRRLGIEKPGRGYWRRLETGVNMSRHNVIAGPQIDGLSIWTIYEHPKDYPEHFVARRWEVKGGETNPTDDILLGFSLAGIREKLPPGLYCLGAHQDDDPAIVECWL